jgi:hypothetical protein
MPTAEFENFWAELQRQPGALRDSLDTARHLGRRLRNMQPEEQIDFIDQLMGVLLQRHHAYGVALFLLEGITDPATLLLIAGHIMPLPMLQTHDEEAYLADLVRILAAANDSRLLGVVDAYLLEREIGPHWSTVPWALWPHHRELFAVAWARYFAEQDSTLWCSTLVIKAFLSEPAAIEAVRQRLCVGAADRWPVLRDALVRQAGVVSWLSAEDRSVLEDSLR